MPIAGQCLQGTKISVRLLSQDEVGLDSCPEVALMRPALLSCPEFKSARSGLIRRVYIFPVYSISDGSRKSCGSWLSLRGACQLTSISHITPDIDLQVSSLMRFEFSFLL